MDLVRADEVHVHIEGAGVTMRPSQASMTVELPTSSSELTPSITAGLPAFPTPTTRPSFTPMSPLTTPRSDR